MNWEILVGLVLTALLLGIIIIPILSLVKIALILRRQEEFAGRLQDIHRLLFRSAATASPPVPTPQPVKPVEPAKSVVSAMPPVVKSASVVKTRRVSASCWSEACQLCASARSDTGVTVAAPRTQPIRADGAQDPGRHLELDHRRRGARARGRLDGIRHRQQLAAADRRS